MRVFKALFMTITLWALLATGVAATEPEKAVETAAKKPIDKETGLIIDTSWELVKGNCTQCHSAQRFTLQRGSRQLWTDIIRWMQKTQGLWQFDPETEKKILDYLEINYAPSSSHYRRAPLPPALMPPNPLKPAAEVVK